MYNLNNIIEYLLYNNLLNEEIEKIKKVRFYPNVIQVYYTISYGINVVIGTKHIILNDFKSFLLKRRIEKINKIKNKI